MSTLTCTPLTRGPSAHYPLYYFIPGFTEDGEFMVVHEESNNDVQLCRLHISSGECIPLTAGKTQRAGWARWCTDSMTGIYTHLSALNVQSEEVWWFESPAEQPQLLQVKARHLRTLAARDILERPGRLPIGQSAFSPDGSLFAFIHADAETFYPRYDRMMEEGGRFEDFRQTIPTVIEWVDTQTGEPRGSVSLPYHVHHVLFVDHQTILVNHPQDGNGMWIMDLHQGPSSIRVLRPQDEAGSICHQVITQRGIDYEVFRKSEGTLANTVGHYYWPEDRWVETTLDVKGYSHTGLDPAGRFCFFEVSGKDLHALYALLHPMDPAKRELRLLKELAPYAGRGQRYHAHPFLTPDRSKMIFTEALEGVSQVFALDVREYTERDDIGWPER